VAPPALEPPAPVVPIAPPDPPPETPVEDDVVLGEVDWVVLEASAVAAVDPATPPEPVVAPLLVVEVE
jgi:hypothetical protein